MELVTEVYSTTENYPETEKYNLILHSRKTSISIPSNIAEGRRRGTRKDYCHFILIAYGSGAELETQIEIAKRLSFGNDIDFKKTDQLLEEVMKMLNKLLKTLKS